MPNCAIENTPIVNCDILSTPIPNWLMLMMPAPNWPIGMTPIAGIGVRLGLYLKETCSNGKPIILVLDLYSNPQPDQSCTAGLGAPQ